VLSFRDTELRSSADSLTYMSHSGRRTPRRRLAAYQAVNSPDDRWQHDERLLERRWISSRKVSRIVTVAKAGQSGLRKRLAWTWPNCRPREAPAAAACPHRVLGVSCDRAVPALTVVISPTDRPVSGSALFMSPGLLPAR